MAKKKKKKIKKRVKILFLFAILLIVSGVILEVGKDNFLKKEEPKKTVEEKVVEEKEVRKEYKASLIMVGDALIHDSIYKDAYLSDGTYDFRPMLELTKPITTQYDLAYYNQETILGGAELGYSNYPRFNSPDAVGDAFIDSGFNLVSLASNHTMDKGEAGVLHSVEYWKSKEGVYAAGSYASFEERDTPVIKEVNGITYSFLSYTTWTNGLPTPVGKEYLSNVYSPELAKADIERVRDKVDIVIVAMHWGTEYSMGISNEQTEIANYLSSLGVDIIIGAHPHVVEPVEYIGKTLVVYSLGNYISDQVGIERLTGLMLSLDIKKVVENDITTITTENLKAELLYTKSDYARKRNFKVYPYSQLDNTILPNYMNYYEKYKQVVTERMPDLQFGLTGEGEVYGNTQ